MHISAQHYQEVTFNTAGLETQFQDQIGEGYRTLMGMLQKMDWSQRHLSLGRKTVDSPMPEIVILAIQRAHRQPGSRRSISQPVRRFISDQQFNFKGVKNGLVC